MYAELMRRVRLKVREIARQKSISMTRLHTRSEVAYNTVRKVWRDPYAEITLTTLGRLAEALEVPTCDLIEDEDVPGI